MLQDQQEKVEKESHHEKVNSKLHFAHTKDSLLRKDVNAGVKPESSSVQIDPVFIALKLWTLCSCEQVVEKAIDEIITIPKFSKVFPMREREISKYLVKLCKSGQWTIVEVDEKLCHVRHLSAVTSASSSSYQSQSEDKLAPKIIKLAYDRSRNFDSNTKKSEMIRNALAEISGAPFLTFDFSKGSTFKYKL